jgi:hypothetical protein
MDAALAVQTLASPNTSYTSTREPSNTVPVAYAPVPKLTSVSTANGQLSGPTAGGTKVSVKGAGFYDGTFVSFINDDEFVMSTDYNLDASKAAPHSAFSVVTTGQLPGQDILAACTVSGCSGDQELCLPGECLVYPAGRDNHVFTFYPPGRPTLSSSRPKKGPAYTIIEVTGANLAFPEAVWLGSHKLRAGYFYQGFAEDGPDFNEINIFVPRGLHIGRTYDIRVATAESEATERDPRTPIDKNVTFTLTKMRKRSVSGVGGI